jgi:hypothetical protein
MKQTIACIATIALAAPLSGCLDDPPPPETPGEAAQAQQAAPPPPRVLTFSEALRSKLFINGVPFGTCNHAAVVGLVALPERIAAYLAFCKMTDLNYQENPPNGNPVNPLDARILGIATAQWRCQVGNAAPIAPANARGAGSVGGMEPLGLVGVANNVAIRDNILLNGTWGFVTSGKPNPLAEPAFQAHSFRANPDIWNRVQTSISCGVDAAGRPMSTKFYTLTSTFFPSHKVWSHTPSNAAAGALLFNVAQRNFSDLWSLPPIPGP